MYEWLAFSLSFNIVWLIIFVFKPNLRKQMLWVSFFTSLTGLTQPIFVPRYWNPPSLFNLTSIAHFDIESLVFSWGAGGIGSVIYETILNVKHRKMDTQENRLERRWIHMASLLSMPVVFGLLTFTTDLNPIYCVTIALFAGALSAVVCRPDLAGNTLAGGLMFTGLYFVLFFLITTIMPSFINAWNLAALSGLLILGVPLEEITYAFAFGMMWSGVYEHIRHYSTRKTNE